MGDPDLSQRARLARLHVESLGRKVRADALDLLGSGARRWGPAGAERRIEQLAQRHRLDPAERMTPLVKAFAGLRPNAVFLQVGASQSRERRGLHAAMAAGGWRGVVAEPNAAVCQELRRRYAEHPEISVEAVAIGPEDGELPFFHLREGDGGPGEAARVPGSLSREALFFRGRLDLELDERIAETAVSAARLDTLLARHGLGSLDLLALDTESDEDTILAQVDFERLRPALVVYGHRHLLPAARVSCRERLAQAGYDAIEHGGDTWALASRWLSPREADVLVALWRWSATAQPERPLLATRALRGLARRAGAARAGRGGTPEPEFPLSDSERRYLRTGYDDRVPLPPGAREYLRPDNPRLLELRRAYAALELPASVWSPERVGELVDLRYFRGDNLYQWHRPDHPRAMALSLFAYMRHLEERGGRGLLGVLGEDGVFGCWSAEFAGYGRVSRDLLDSAAEILFLEREFGLRGRTELRVLDIGAGYGRLAHRMSAALPSLADYCCVDAIPESTFLCEYYLNFRGASPPARVVALNDVTSALEPGGFDLAVNVHSFSECPLAAIRWWMELLVHLRVPHLFVVPNEPDGLVSREPDGGYHDAMPVLAAAGYTPTAKERVIVDPAVRELVRLNDNFYLFELAG